MHLLVIDDDPDIRDVLSYWLARRGHKVSSVEDGLFALTRLRAEPPDLILLDLDMPGLSGEEFVRECRGAPRWAAVPFFLLSGREDIASLANRLGAAGHLQKPYRVGELQRMIDALRDGRSRASGTG